MVHQLDHVVAGTEAEFFERHFERHSACSAETGPNYFHEVLPFVASKTSLIPHEGLKGFFRSSSLYATKVREYTPSRHLVNEGRLCKGPGTNNPSPEVRSSPSTTRPRPRPLSDGLSCRRARLRSPPRVHAVRQDIRSPH